jgi:hypothetical protein
MVGDGRAAEGVIDPAGVYTAPAQEGAFHVVASSHADPAKTAAAEVKVARDVAVTVSPQSVTVQEGATQRFSAAVSGTPETRVTWSIAEGPAGGSVDASGLYTAPAAAGTFHVVATSAVDPSGNATAVVTVPPAAVAISPSTITVNPDTHIQFTATVTGTTDKRVDWFGQDCARGDCSAGIRDNGFYNAPHWDGVYHLVARSVAAPSKMAVATITVFSTAELTVQIDPAKVDIHVGNGLQFRAHLTGTTDTAVAWSIKEGAQGGSIDANGMYQSPRDREGVHHVVATSHADPAKSATAELTVSWYDLIDRGGPVAASTRIYAIWWGDPSAYPADMLPAIEALLGGLEGSSYLALANQYLLGATAHSVFAGSLVDTSTPPASPPDPAVVAAEACRAIDAGGITPRGGVLYLVYASAYPKFPPGMVNYCGWHSWGTCHDVPVLIAYLPNPAGSACHSIGAAGQCDCFSLEANALCSYSAHEIMEAITDPYVTSWMDS